MDIISAYREVGTYRGVAEICGTTHKTVRRTVERAEAGGLGRAEPADRPHNYTDVTGVVATRVVSSFGRIRSYPDSRTAPRTCCASVTAAG